MRRLLHTLLSESCIIHSKKTALRFKDRSLSYQGLELQSSHLASLLMRNGVSSGARIGIYMDKSLESIISLFGILKTGSCYVPLDPVAPPVRLNLIIKDCSLEWLITSYAKLPVVKSLAGQAGTIKHVVVVDAERQTVAVDIPGAQMYFSDDISRIPDLSLEVPISPTSRDLAYILYTSGSTGQPKGVMISHRAAIAFVDWSLRAFNVCNDDILSSHAPLHFDLSVFDIFASIAAGATLCLIPQGWSSFPRTIADFIRENRITTWYSVPSALVQLVLYGRLEEKDLPDLKRILFAGEVFPVKYLRHLMTILPTVDFYNLYGPTETNVITSHHVKEPPDSHTGVPIGSLCDGVKAYVVSESGSLAAEGEIGELYIESPTLMDGYWCDEKKTQTVFQTNPYVHSGQNLIYKTGDLVHWNKEGLLVYHGRCDSMIKSRGYRIELGEIETVLSAHKDIKEVAVFTAPSEEIGTVIKAVIAVQPEAGLSETDIRLYCSEILPAYMVPESIRVVSTLPRTSTGKIDRKAIASSGD